MKATAVLMGIDVAGELQLRHNLESWVSHHDYDSLNYGMTRAS